MEKNCDAVRDVRQQVHLFIPFLRKCARNFKRGGFPLENSQHLQFVNSVVLHFRRGSGNSELGVRGFGPTAVTYGTCKLHADRVSFIGKGWPATENPYGVLFQIALIFLI